MLRANIDRSLAWNDRYEKYRGPPTLVGDLHSGMNINESQQLGVLYQSRNAMTHTPPIPAANQARYPPTASTSAPNADKAALVSQMKSNSDKEQASGSALPIALLVGAAVAGAIGYVFWTDRTSTVDQK